MINNRIDIEKLYEFLNECETECTDLVLKNYLKITFLEFWSLIHSISITPLRYQDWMTNALKQGFVYFSPSKEKQIKIKFSREFKSQNENIT